MATHFYSVTGKILARTISDASLCLCTNRLPACIHPFLVVPPEFNTFNFHRTRPAAKDVSSVAIVHLMACNTYRMGCPFTMIGELEPLCISGLIHLLTLVILDLNTQIISVHER